LEYGYDHEWVWDNVPPRIVGFLLEQAQRRRLVRLLDDLHVVHGDPKKVEAHLRHELQAWAPAEKRPTFNEGLAALAEKLGDRNAVRRMRRADKVYARLAAIKGAEA